MEEIQEEDKCSQCGYMCIIEELYQCNYDKHDELICDSCVSKCDNCDEYFCHASNRKCGMYVCDECMMYNG